jgi:hypothetical protein
VADRFLLLNTFLSLEVVSSNSQGHSVSARQAWLGAGTGELLHLTTEKDLLTLELSTPTAALDQIRTYFTHFDALPAPALEVLPLALMIQNGISAGKVIDLGEETVLGRSEQADIHLLDSRASRRHSVIRRLNEGFMLNDAGSTNGTFLNNQPVTTPTALAEGDMILIGETLLKVVRAGFIPAQTPEVSAPTMLVGEALRGEGETPPPPVPAPAPEAEPMPPAPPPVRQTPPADGIIRLTPTAPHAPAQEQKIPPDSGAKKSETPAPPPARETPPADGIVRLTPPTPPAPPPPAPGVVKLVSPEPPSAAAPAPSGPRPAETPETPPRWFVPPPPPVKPAPVIPPPPTLTPAPFEAPPSGPAERPANSKPAQCARCREPLNPKDLVCSHCGQPVGQPVVSTAPVLPQTMAVCPKCFSPIDYGARFCGTCGHKLM